MIGSFGGRVRGVSTNSIVSVVCFNDDDVDGVHVIGAFGG